MADREPWERSDNPEPWTRPDKAAPWLRKKSDKDQEPQETNGQSDVEPWDRPARSSSSSTVSALRNAENNAVAAKEPSYYTGNGRGSSNNSSNKGPKLKGKKRGVGALITMLIIFGGMGVFLGTSNSLLAPALSALLTSGTQTNYTSYVMRSKYLTKNMLKGTGADAVNSTWSGQIKYSKIPNYMKRRLAKNGIEVIGSGSATKLRWDDMDIDADQFVELYNTNPKFRDAYSKAKYGRIATFFDNAADKLYKKLGISRNWRSGLKDTGDAAEDMKNYKNKLSSQFDDDSRTTLHTNTDGYKEEWVDDVDEDGNPIKVKKKVPASDATDASSIGGSSGSDIETANNKAQSFLTSAAGKVASEINAVLSVGCSLMKIGNMIAITVAANEIYQSINYFMGQLEGPSKMMAGYGDESGINAQLNILTTSTTSSVTDFNKVNVNISNSSYSSTDANNIPMQDESGSPMEAPLLLKLMSNAPASQADASNYSLERVIKKFGGTALFGVATTGVCAGLDVVSSVISISSVFAGGIPAFVGNFLVKTLATFAISTGVSMFFGFLIPTVARALFTNIFETATGIQSGNLIAQGAYAANSRNGRTGSGQSISDENATYAFNRATNEVLAMEAEQDRLNHSPFDTTNGNTFFGSIAYSLIPTLTSTKVTGVASFIRSASKSLSIIINPRVSAEGEGSDYMTTYGDCPLLDEIGVVGDLFCNPIVTTDITTVDMEPTDPTYVEVIGNNMKSCDDEGNCEINPKENLAKYITYCDGRDSPFGVIDQNILGQLHGGMDNAVVNSIPLVGDIQNIINAIGDVSPENIEWANGKRCSNSSDNSTFWNEEGKYYQRYVEDQRILEQMGAYEDGENPVIAYENWYEEQYRKEHPESDTYIGYLSRISGLTPENTETVVAFATYYNFVDNYDPSNRIAMTGDTTEIKPATEVIANINDSLIRFTDTNKTIYNPLETKATSREYIAYFDIRNRSYTV